MLANPTVCCKIICSDNEAIDVDALVSFNMPCLDELKVKAVFLSGVDVDERQICHRDI